MGGWGGDKEKVGTYTMTLRIVISNSLIIPMNNTVHREWM